MRSKGGPAGARQASPRALAIAGGVIVVVIVAVVLGIVLSSGGKNNGSGDGPKITIPAGIPAVGSSTSATAVPSAADVASMLKGIPQTGFVLGKYTAPVTLIEYVDLQCPDCQAFETTQMPTLIEKYVRTGKLKIMIQPWSILDFTADEHDSTRGQNAVIAASRQNLAFNFAAVLYDNQGTEHTNWMNDAVISNIAASVDGLVLSQWASDANSSATAGVAASVAAFAAAHANAQTGEMRGTPTLYLQKGTATPKWYGTGVPDLTALEKAIDKLIAG